MFAGNQDQIGSGGAPEVQDAVNVHHTEDIHDRSQTPGHHHRNAGVKPGAGWQSHYIHLI